MNPASTTPEKNRQPVAPELHKPPATPVKKPVKVLPILAKLAFKPLPNRLLAQGIEHVLNQVLQPELKRRQLDFLHHHWLRVQVPDLALDFGVTLRAGRLEVSMGATPKDVCFKAAHTELLLLLTGQADPDTLFFRRKLSISGDTELGLHIKNLLDTLEPESRLPKPLYHWLVRYTSTLVN